MEVRVGGREGGGWCWSLRSGLAIFLIILPAVARPHQTESLKLENFLFDSLQHRVGGETSVNPDHSSSEEFQLLGLETGIE